MADLAHNFVISFFLASSSGGIGFDLSFMISHNFRRLFLKLQTKRVRGWGEDTDEKEMVWFTGGVCGGAVGEGT